MDFRANQIAKGKEYFSSGRPGGYKWECRFCRLILKSKGHVLTIDKHFLRLSTPKLARTTDHGLARSVALSKVWTADLIWWSTSRIAQATPCLSSLMLSTTLGCGTSMTCQNSKKFIPIRCRKSTFKSFPRRSQWNQWRIRLRRRPCKWKSDCP